MYYTFNSQLTTYFGIVVTVFGLAFLVSIIVEASFLNIEKLCFAAFTPRMYIVPKLDICPPLFYNMGFQLNIAR